ncbi:MAG: type II toxin-antitoxin system RelE/ParE family toxin [Clostridiales Family XIII bacterium]|jgi:mRNA interferase RelE/StbE|nr:type II toxin-antitoxin system RelE/ParE family toxin [Clostridiales Family XIII bacterium]
MSYKLVIDDKAKKQLKKIDHSQGQIIANWIDKNLVGAVDPRQLGKALTGNLKGFWRYRVGSYRILAEISDDVVTIFIIDIDHRSKVYL